MDKEEIKKRISELESQEKKAWADCQAYESSDEYKQSQAKHDSLNKAWHDVYTKITALKTLLEC